MSAAAWIPGVILLPLGIVAEAVVIWSGFAVDELSQDIGVASMLGSLGDHANEQHAQGGGPAVFGPVRHLARGFECEIRDGPVGMRAGTLIEPDDVLAGLVGPGPHVCAFPDRTVLDPGQRLLCRPVERFAEVSVLKACQMLDQAQQVCGGGRHGPAHVVFGESLQLGEQTGPSCLQLAVQLRFEISHVVLLQGCGHPTTRL